MVKYICSFLGHVGFYRRFINDINNIARPLSHLFVQDVQFKWMQACQKAFNTLKQILTTTPLMQHLDQSLPLEIILRKLLCNMSSAQAMKRQKKPQMTYYTNKTLNDAQMNYTTIQKELLVIVFTLNKFHHIFWSNIYQQKKILSHDLSDGSYYFKNSILKFEIIREQRIWALTIFLI